MYFFVVVVVVVVYLIFVYYANRYYRKKNLCNGSKKNASRKIFLRKFMPWKISTSPSRNFFYDFSLTSNFYFYGIIRL